MRRTVDGWGARSPRARTVRVGRLRGAALVAGLGLGCVDKGGDSGADVNLSVYYVGCYLNGSTIDCEVGVENLGTSDAGSFQVGVYTDHGGDPSPGESADGTATIKGLAAGETAVAEISVSGGASTSLWALADAKGAIDESDETDNVSGPLTPNQRR